MEKGTTLVTFVFNAPNASSFRQNFTVRYPSEKFNIAAEAAKNMYSS